MDIPDIEQTVAIPVIEVIDLFQQLQKGNYELVFLLLEQRNLSYEDLKEPQSGNLLLHLAILENRLVESLMIIQMFRDKIDLPNSQMQTPLMFACYLGNLPIIKLLIKNGCAVNQMDKFQFTPLLYAVKGNFDLIVIYLVSRGADLHAKDLNGCTVVHWAAYKNNRSLVTLFVKHFQLSYIVRDWQEHTPFMKAVTNFSYDVVDWFLEFLKVNDKHSLEVIPNQVRIESIAGETIQNKIRLFLKQRNRSRCFQPNEKRAKFFRIMKFLFIYAIFQYTYIDGAKFWTYFLLDKQIQLKKYLFGLNDIFQVSTLIFTFLCLYFLDLFDFGESEQKKTQQLRQQRVTESISKVEMDSLISQDELESQTDQLPPMEEDLDNPYHYLNKLLGSNKLTFLHEIIRMISEDKYPELGSIKPEHLNYDQLRIIQERAQYCKETKEIVPLFCFYSNFFGRSISYGFTHRLYMFLQTMCLICLGLYIVQIVLCFDGQYSKDSYHPIEVVLIMIKYREISIIHPIAYVLAYYIIFVLCIQWLINIFGMLSNQTYFEIMNNEKCYYYYRNVVQVDKPKNTVWYYSVFRNPYGQGILRNIRFYLTAQ